MKSVFLLKMRPWVYLTEIPLMILLVICWNTSELVGGLVGLWPLIIFLMAMIIFLSIYFFRLVEVSWEEIRDIGRFTKGDSAVINEGRTLNIKLLSRGRIKLTLMGHDGEYAGFDWMKPEDGEPQDIAMYRGNAYGGERAAKRLLLYFGADEADFAGIFGEGRCEREYEFASVVATGEDDGRLISIRINRTLTRDGVPIEKKNNG